MDNHDEINKRFEELPEYIRETIIQSGVEIESVEQLNRIVDNMNK